MYRNHGYKKDLEWNPQKHWKTIHLSEYINVLSKRKFLIIAVLLVTVLVALLHFFFSQPIYEASAKLLIDKEEMASPITGEKVDYSTYESQQLTFNTHFTLVESKPVILSLIKELKLDKRFTVEPAESTNPLKKQLKNLKNNIKLLLGKEVKELSSEERLEMLIRRLQDAIHISPVRDTRLLAISVNAGEAEGAAKMANTLAQKYIEFDMDNRLTASKNNLEWMNNQIYELQKRLEGDEKKFHEFKQMNKLFSIKGKQDVIGQKIGEFNNEYLAARNKRLEIEAKLEEISKITRGGTDITRVRSIINNPTIDSIYDNLTKLELEGNRLNKVFKKKHPKIVQNEGEIQKNQKKLKSELNKELENLSTEKAVLAAREKVMEKNISEFEEDAVDASGKELNYSILERNISTSQSLYDNLVTKVKESGLMSKSGDSNIRVVEQAAVPIYPVSPNRNKNLMLGAIVGLMGGIGLAFFLEYLDQTVRTEEDVENYLKLPVLSSIPLADASDRKGAI